MTDSLRESELGAAAAPTAAYGELRSAPSYEPDEAAYAVDETNNPYRRLHESIAAGGRITLSLACKDGRREKIELDAMESAAWERDSLDDRLRFANAKIAERRAGVAIAAAERLREHGLAPTADNVTPEEEAYLREFGMLADVHEPLDEGGYRIERRLSEAAYQRTSRALREDGFWDGFGNDAAGYGYQAPTQREYLPPGGPMGQQQMISDVWDAQAKCYWAWTHDPVAREACELIADFVLGRGISIIANDKRVQTVIDEFSDREQLGERLHQWTVSLSRDGELFARKFPLGDGRMKVRTTPPETIWEIVTDAEDPLTVFWYVQRYQTRVVLFANIPEAATRWIERTILAQDMIHVKLNAKESDVRGRSDLFPALGWMKRLRDYFDAIIQKEYAAAAYQWHYKIKGGAGDISRIASSVIPAARPQPGSYMLTNELVDVGAIASTVRTVSGSGSAYESLLNHIAIAFGLSKDYFGASSHTNRASALVATEPAAKHFETRQNVIGAFLDKLLKDVVKEAVRYGLLHGVSDFGFKVQFPSIIKADAAARIDLLRKAEASGYISKQTAAEQSAGELEIDDYDFLTEMTKIEQEIGQDPRKLIGKDLSMVEKGAPRKTDPAWNPGEVPNPAASAPPAAGGSAPPAPTPKTHDAATPTSAAGAATIHDQQGRGGASDKSTMESDAQLREYARKRGAILILP